MMPNNNDLGPAPGGPEAVKMALKRIYERDKLRYLMIFKYVGGIGNEGLGGGLALSGHTGTCGYFTISFSSPVKILDKGIVHESTHSAEFCNGTLDVGGSEGEYVAVANDAGSVGGVKESPGQKEEVKVTVLPQIGPKKDNPSNNSNDAERLECTGYQARWLNKDIDPVGDMNETAIGSSVSYAKGHNGRNRDGAGIWVYGYPRGGEEYTLRINNAERNNLLRILETMDRRKCMSRPPEDLPQLEEKDYSEQLLNGCKEVSVMRIGG